MISLASLLFSAVSILAPPSHAIEGAGTRSAATGDSVRIPVLVYHSVLPHHPGQTASQRVMDVDPVTFEAQMQLLRQCGVSVIPFGTLVDVLNGTVPAPPHAAVVTFDDGWENEYRHAFPVLKRLGIPATFFVFTAPIGKDSRFLNWEQLREMRDAGMSIESHSRTHPVLTHDGPALMRELVNSRDDIAKHLGQAPMYFAYPFGNEDDRVVAAVRAAGYRAARGFGGGTWNTAKSLWDLKSVEVTDDMNAFRRTLHLPDVLPAGCPAPPAPPSVHRASHHQTSAARIGA